MAVLAGFNTLALLGSAFIFYCIGLVLYRLILSLLSKFPGPKFAAATLWYEFYYEVVKRGQLTFKIQEWHRKFGISLSPHRHNTISDNIKAQSSASILMRFTSTIPNSIQFSSRHPAFVTKMNSTLPNSGPRSQHLALWHTTFIVCADNHSILSSRKLLLFD